MTPPINIDGSTVDAITIDGTEVTEVTADGEVVFGSAIPTNQWLLDEGTGTTAADRIASADATLNGNVSWASGTWIGNNALSSPGNSGDYLDLTTLGTFGSTMDQGFAWIFTFETTDQNILFGAVDGNQEFVIGLGGSIKGTAGAINFEIDDDGNSNTEAVETDDSTFDDGAKYRCVCQTGDATADSHEIWINGSQESTTTISSQGGSTYSDFSNPIYGLAYNDGGDVDNIAATIDNVIRTDRTLSSSEIQEDYDEQPWS